MKFTTRVQQRHDANSFRVHGTYPYDKGKGNWIKVIELSWVQAADLVGIDPNSVEAPRWCCSMCGQPSSEDTAENRSVYLWLNKGYIIPEMAKSTEPFEVVPGMYAVYLHDGSYSLIVRRS